MSDEKVDYQSTLNLPKTDFSMRAGLVNKEPAFLEQWKKDGVYEQIRKNSEGKKTFTLHDGPPYANGDIHMGHALNKLLKDFIVKSKTMQGYDSLYIPGWDCHGLPIEHKLLKEMKQHKSQVDCVEFRKKAHDYALKYVDIQKEQFKQLGIFGEWDEPYLTLTPEYEYWILKSLATLSEKGYVYRGLKPVNWCCSCETALAEAEVEYEDHTSPSVYVKFAVKNPDAIGLADKKVSLLIWTTTPWTLLANVAVAVHAGFTYSCVEVKDEILIIESSLRNKVLAKAGIEDAKVIKEVKGEELTQLLYSQPFDRLDKCRVVATDYVTKEDGTGLVHTAPGHGQDDFQSGVKYGLPILMPVNDRGVYTEEGGKYEGMHVYKANPVIIEDMKASGALFAAEDISHSYPHCWRCKKPIIFRATHQWFLKVDHEGLRDRLVEVIQNDVKWIPAAGQERIMGMISTRPDWCLSRQRYWGVPIPAVACKGCKEEHFLFTEVVEYFANIVKVEGTNAWFEKDIKELMPQGFTCPHCGGTEFKKTSDILDVWFDSGVSHQAVMKARLGKELPVDMYLEGSDQHRGWFQSSLIPAVAMENKAPYKEVLTHGFIVDGQGRKMSKSMGNVVSPLDIMKNSGADILRLWVASCSYNDDIRLSKEILDRSVDAYRKIRNTFRYFLGNLHGFNPDTNTVEYQDLMAIDQWGLYRLAQTVEQVKKDFNEYNFSKVYRAIFVFCNEDLSSFYLDILKDRLYTSSTNSKERRSAQTVLFHITNHLIRVLAPILSFTMQEVLQAMPRDKELKEIGNVHLLQWLEIPQEWNNAQIEKDFDLLVKLRPHVLKALEDKRRDSEIGSSLEAKVIFKTASVRDYEYLLSKVELLPASFIVSQVEVLKQEKVENGLSDFFAQTQVVIEKADGHKCPRCWNYKVDIGQNKEYSDLCVRCADNVKRSLTDAAEEIR